ncbi:MAG: hypothetical protein AAFP90_17950 [Planctomycetota bacterium]
MTIKNQTNPRVPFGQESDESTKGLDNCGVCVVVPNQYHVLECEIEEFPNCSQQLLGCGCNSDSNCDSECCCDSC